MAASNAKTLKRLLAFKRSRFDATKKNAHNHTDFCNYNFVVQLAGQVRILRMNKLFKQPQATGNLAYSFAFDASK